MESKSGKSFSIKNRSERLLSMIGYGALPQAPQKGSLTLLKSFLLLTLFIICGIFAPLAQADPPSGELNELEIMNYRGIWDGRFTKAKSGLGFGLYDAGSSEGERGTGEAPMKFYYPTFKELNRQTSEVERDELLGNFKIKDYTHTAVVQVPRKLKAFGYTLPKGYYQVYLGDHYSGSEEKHLGRYDISLPPKIAKQRKKGKIKRHTAIIFKRQGRVVAAAPISRWQRYKRNDTDASVKKHPYAEVVETSNGAALEVYFKKKLYVVDLDPVRETATSTEETFYPPASPMY